MILAHQGQAAWAAELLALASTHPAAATGWMAAWAPVAQLADRLQHDLGPEEFRLAWERGRALDLQAAAEAWLSHAAG